MSKAPYKTKQMAELLTFLESVQGKHVTVNEICDYFKEKGISVGTTTVYRHCKCEKCGKLIHLHCDEVESLKKHMMEHHSFEMDSLRTVFYGICNECRNNKE